MGREREWKLLSKTTAKPATISPKKLNWAQYQKEICVVDLWPVRFSKVPITFQSRNLIEYSNQNLKARILGDKLVHFVLLTDSFIMLICKTIETSILNVNNNSSPGPVYEQVIPGCGIGATPFKYSIYTLSWGILGRFTHANEGGEMKKGCFLINNRETENRVLACKQNVLSRSLSIMGACMYGS